MNKIQKLQTQKTPITCLTAYTYPIAKILDKHCDVILVGDSLGMTIYGMENTRGVSLEMMIEHGRAVTRAAKNALVVVDMNFGTYEFSPNQALQNAKKIIEETSCDCVKLEITKSLIPTVKFLVEQGIAVMGHIGLLPQSVKEKSGYKYQGKDKISAQEILETAIELEKAGAFAIVIEAVPAALANQITQTIKIPTIGIGAGKSCSGQVLVIDDILGLNPDFKPSFAKQYKNLGEEIEKAVKEFCGEVRNKEFPNEKQSYS